MKLEKNFLSDEETMSEFYLGIDVGTSGTKVLLVQETGSVVDAAISSYSVSRPEPGQAEQDPELWWNALKTAMAQLHEKHPEKLGRVRGLGFSGQMHGCVCLDSNNEVLRPAIIWMDKRTEKQVQVIYEKVGRQRLYEITGNPLDTGFMLPGLMWLFEHEPARMKNCRTVLLPKDYLRYRLTGVLSTDPADACSTGAFNIYTKLWSDEILAGAGLSPEIFPDIFPSTQIVGSITSAASADLFLPPGIPVVQGGGDQGAGAFGAGILNAGDGMVTIATGGQVLQCVEQVTLDKQQRLHTFVHVLPEKWLKTGATLNAGYALRWLRDHLLGHPVLQAAGIDFNIINQLAAEAAPGCDGLLFKPYLNGERTPYFDSNLTAAFQGIRADHGLPHFVRAVMEGVALSLYHCLVILKEGGWQPQELLFSGGGAKSPVWQQILADILHVPLRIHPVTDHSPLGAAWLALLADGGQKSVYQEIERLHQSSTVIFPDPSLAKIYQELFQKFRD
ncbi:xylulokinase [bacterium]|nr:xylulokinase [bacterium]